MLSKFFSSGFLVFLKGIICSFCGAVLLGLVNYLIRRHLAVTLSVTDFGFFYSMFALFSLLTTFFQFGVKQASTVLTASCLAKHQEKRINYLVSTLLLICTLSGFLLMLLLVCGRNFLAVSFFKYPEAVSALVVFAPFVLLNPVWSIFISIPHAKLDFLIYNILNVSQMVFVLIAVWLFAGSGLLPMAGAWIAALLVAVSASVLVVFKKYHIKAAPRFTRSRMISRKIWNLCSWMSGSMAGIMILSNLDSFCLTWLTDLKQVAAYNIALPVMQILQTLMVLPLVFLPVSAKMWEEHKFAELRRIFLLVNTVLLLGVVPVILFFHFAGAWIITLMFGKQFISSAPALTVMGGGILFYVAGQFNLNLLNSTGRQKTGTFIVVLTICWDFLLNLLLIPKFGFYGAAWALSFSYLFIALLTFFPCNRSWGRAIIGNKVLYRGISE